MKTMKICLGMAITLLLLIGCNQQNQEADPIPSSGPQSLRVAEIELPGLYCAGCSESSEYTFKGMNGVVDAKVDLSTKKGTVIYDSNVISKEQLVDHGLIQMYDGQIGNDQEYIRE